MSQQSVGETGEFALIDQVTSDLVMPAAVQVGPGDDAAVFQLDGQVVVSTDTLVENVHFRRSWSSGTDVGRKTVAVSTTDIEAMGAVPVTLVVALTVPADLPAQWVRDFSTGIRTEAELAGVTLVGGDTTRGSEIVVTATVIGQLQGRRPVTRGGARPGDVVAVAGHLGWAGAGLTILGRGFRSPRVAADEQRHPTPPYGQGPVAADAGATAMVDISDGLLADLGHIAHQSGVQIELRSDDLPVDEPVETVAAATNRNPIEFVLTGGEDHALAATFPPGSLPIGWRVIGAVTEADPDAPAPVTVDGRMWPGSQGWDHFKA